ncbi:hypothetical protein [Chitinivibrio alkaliphilus]|uniref:LTD domain-containing protein n=1 Tax=Chitinivibrio alkaliphilus ACht1 TaxID=1313304 RepID=U7DA25_9BACT|nr:hypothetical protein [Chitinivibrio alkaliphilus]ERP31952.1 hypothetical protein CALK_1172 [Chitinivibrio alkaliphilus ACht1]
MKGIGVFLIFILLLSCSSEFITESTGSTVQVAVSLEGVNQNQNLRYTTYSNLHIRVKDAGGDPIADTTIQTSGDIELVNFEHIVEGEYDLTAWTTDEEGDTIHAPQEESITIAKERIETVQLRLIPLVGSMIAQLYELPMETDSVVFAFSSDSGFFEARQERSLRMVLSLDKIPFDALGTVSLTTLRDGGDTISHWDTLYTFTRENHSMEVNLMNNGDLAIDISTESAPITLFSASGDTTEVLAEEVDRGVLITEFCATGGGTGGREFLEIQNRGDTAQTIKDLRFIHNSREYSLGEVVLAPSDFFVIGTLNARDVWEVDTVVNMSLASTSGALFILDGEELLDYLIYFNDYDAAGWPALSASARRSWVLREDVHTPQGNNFGTAWKISRHVYAEFDGDTWYGNPGDSGR